MFEVIEQRANGHARAHEDRRAAEDFGVRMHARNFVLHGLALPMGDATSIRPSFVVLGGVS